MLSTINISLIHRTFLLLLLKEESYMYSDEQIVVKFSPYLKQVVLAFKGGCGACCGRYDVAPSIVGVPPGGRLVTPGLPPIWIGGE